MYSIYMHNLILTKFFNNLSAQLHFDGHDPVSLLRREDCYIV